MNSGTNLAAPILRVSEHSGNILGIFNNFWNFFLLLPQKYISHILDHRLAIVCFPLLSFAFVGFRLLLSFAFICTGFAFVGLCLLLSYAFIRFRLLSSAFLAFVFCFRLRSFAFVCSRLLSSLLSFAFVCSRLLLLAFVCVRLRSFALVLLLFAFVGFGSRPPKSTIVVSTVFS
jgi:hypothetical protein